MRQGFAEITISLRLIRCQLDGPAQRDLGLGKPLETQQCGSTIDVCAQEVRDQRDGSPGTLKPGLEQALIIQRTGEIGVRHTIVRIELDRPPIAIRRLA
jgi:hypothetical protein